MTSSTLWVDLFLYKIAPRTNIFNILKSRLSQIESSRLNKLLNIRCRLVNTKLHLQTLHYCLENSIYDKSVLIRVRRNKLHPCPEICDRFLEASISECQNKIPIYQNHIIQLSQVEKDLPLWLFLLYKKLTS
jgi:hypothetical protein